MSKKKISILLFKASWCPHCVKFEPTFDAVVKESKKLGKDVDFVKFEETNKDHAEHFQAYEISSFPTLLMIKPKAEIVLKYAGPRDFHNVKSFVFLHHDNPQLKHVESSRTVVYANIKKV